MGFYRRVVSYEDVQPHIKEFSEFLRKYGKLLNNPKQDGYESFLFADEHGWNIFKEFKYQYELLRQTGYIQAAPIAPKQYILIMQPNKGMYEPTVSPTYVRLPKLSYLITLTYEDFFLLMQLIANSKVTQTTKDSFSLPLSDFGIAQTFEDLVIGNFFTKLKVNYRMNLDYTDKKWTSFETIKRIADLEPTFENHLVGMQYLTARQNDDLFYFPTETAIELEITDWPQVTDDYVIPENDGVNKHN